MRQITTILMAVLIFITLTSLSINASNDCQIAHNGTFKYGDSPTEIIVKINDQKHVEYHNSGKYVIESKLVWVTDCEYNMTMTKITIPDFPYHSGDVMNVKIDNVIDNQVFYTSTVKGQSWRGSLIKIE